MPSLADLQGYVPVKDRRLAFNLGIHLKVEVKWREGKAKVGVALIVDDGSTTSTKTQ